MFQVKPLIKPFFSQPIRKHDVNVINYKRMWPKVELPFKIFLVEKRGFISANVRSPVIQLTFFYRVLEFTSDTNKDSTNFE